MNWVDGSSYKGDWELGKEHGFGMIKLPNGKLKAGKFENNKYMGDVGPDTVRPAKLINSLTQKEREKVLRKPPVTKQETGSDPIIWTCSQSIQTEVFRPRREKAMQTQLVSKTGVKLKEKQNQTYIPFPVFPATPKTKVKAMQKNYKKLVVRGVIT